jgi:hypothetical protein
MRIQIASDLHLELRPKTTYREILEPAAPVLALLGDIAPLDHPNLRPFMEWCSERWDTVLWIPGLLEIHSGGTKKMQGLVEPFWNISVLDHEGMISEDGVYVFGLTFWPFPREDVQVWHPEKYQYVPAEPSPIDPAIMRQLHNRDLEWIRSKLQTDPVVILSYYGPTMWIQQEKFLGDPDLSMTFPEMEMLLKPPMVAWLCGHTHRCVQMSKEWRDATGKKGAIFLATNPKGRPYENLEFRPDAVVRIDPKLA